MVRMSPHIVGGWMAVGLCPVAVAQDCLPEPSDACVHPVANVVTVGDLGAGTTVGVYAHIGADVELGD